jgi:HrpA-like RNA helicase
MPVRGKMEGAPVIAVEGKIFPVKEVYVDDMSSLGQVNLWPINFTIIIIIFTFFFHTMLVENAVLFQLTHSSSKHYGSFSQTKYYP